MKKILTTGVVAAAAYTASSMAALAQSADYYCSYYGVWCNETPTTSVPEIDASSGLLAMAAVLGALVLAWEIKRRRA